MRYDFELSLVPAFNAYSTLNFKSATLNLLKMSLVEDPQKGSTNIVDVVICGSMIGNNNF